MVKRVPEIRTDRARSLRRNATDAERKLWRLISRYRPKFTRQLPVGPYIVDFACREAKLIVEMDGGQHADSASDRTRDAFLAGEGWRVVRIWNNEMLANPDAVVAHIMAEAAECLGDTHPRPFPSREGRERRPRY